jgi:signal transduction histidine kinase
MTSLPMPTTWPQQPLLPTAPEALPEDAVIPAGQEDEKFLLRAFRSFAEAAGSLERSYGLLREEVERLRLELEDRNADLAASLDENRSIRARLDRILEGLPCGVLVVSAQGEITRANPEALRLLDMMTAPDRVSLLPAFLADRLANIRVRDVNKHSSKSHGLDNYNPDHHTFNYHYLNNNDFNNHDLNGDPKKDTLNQKKPGSNDIDEEEELTIPLGAGRLRWLAVRQASIFEGAGRSSVFILRDISERKQLEAAQARLRREQALAEMSSLLAHEMRNPLASLELFAGLLLESGLDGERRQWVEQVQAGLRILAATVNNVLHFHSLPEPEHAALDLGTLLDWARDFFAPLARQSGITLSSQNRLRGIFLEADRYRMEQVLLNLVLNGVRAMPGGGWIEIGGYKTANGQCIVLSVADTGPGIAPEHLETIFEAGFSTRNGSPGLGLAVCRKIVGQHGGTIRAVSRPGRGAAFTILLPLVRRATTQPRPEGVTADRPPSAPAIEPEMETQIAPEFGLELKPFRGELS